MSEPVTPSIRHLALAWRSIAELCDDLTDAQWGTPTGCPGWDVKDQISHLIDFEARSLGPPQSCPPLPALDHIQNEMGQRNERAVEARRRRSGREVLAEFLDVTTARSAQLEAMTAEDLRRETETPVGIGTMAERLTMRVMDTWLHEQDIRRALRRPGHNTGPAAIEAINYLTKFLPTVIGQRVAMPDGTVIALNIGSLRRVSIAVEGGEARFDDGDSQVPATVTISLTPAGFAARAGGRTDPPLDLIIEGDHVLGLAVAAHLGFTP